jgi:1-phosphofructokinase family hexose kinase
VDASPTPEIITASQIVTVTPNSTIDRVLFVDHFAFGETVRASDAAWGMGGKSAVSSFVLGQLGTPSLATGFVAGETGRRMLAMLQEQGVQTDFLSVAGETRTTYVIARSSDGQQCTITYNTLQTTAADGVALAAHVRALLARGGARVLFVGGSLPAGLPMDWYVPLLREARAQGLFTALDVAMPYLAANLAAPPHLVKPNAPEASALLGRPIDTVEDAVSGVRELQARGVDVPIITLGDKGAVAATPDGLYHVPALPVRAINTAGAGDGFNAGLLQARLRGATWAEALRWAGAVATAILLTPGTGVLNVDDAHRLHPQMRVVRL